MAKIRGIEHLMVTADDSEALWVLSQDSEPDVNPVTYPLYFAYNGERPGDPSATPAQLPDVSKLSGDELIMNFFGDTDTSNEGER